MAPPGLGRVASRRDFQSAAEYMGGKAGGYVERNPVAMHQAEDPAARIAESIGSRGPRMHVFESADSYRRNIMATRVYRARRRLRVADEDHACADGLEWMRKLTEAHPGASHAHWPSRNGR